MASKIYRLIDRFGVCLKEMETESYYEEYARLALADYEQKDPAERDHLVDSLNGVKVSNVLDIGCGAGQEMLSFFTKKDAFCVGVDIGEELGKVGPRVAEQASCSEGVTFARSVGEELPFCDEAFDVVLCRIAINYMNNQRTIAEVARVLKPKGVFLLKTHSPFFYFEMIKNRIGTLSPKQLAYPLISLAGGAYQVITGKYPNIELWKGREVFQTRGTLEKELRKNSLKIKKYLPDTNREAPSYYIIKN